MTAWGKKREGKGGRQQDGLINKLSAGGSGLSGHRHLSVYRNLRCFLLLLPLVGKVHCKATLDRCYFETREGDGVERCSLFGDQGRGFINNLSITSHWARVNIKSVHSGFIPHLFTSVVKTPDYHHRRP